MQLRVWLTLAMAILATPGVAQISADQVTPEIDRQIWCGVAFSVVASEARRSERGQDASVAADRSRWLLTKAAEALITGPQQTAQDFQGLTANYAARVVSPFAGPEVPEADCIALAEAARPQ